MAPSKTIAVSSPEELWRKFSQAYGEEEFPRIRWRPAAGRAEIRIEHRGKTRSLAVEPELHPSRRLLETGDVEDGRLILSPALGEPLARDLRAAGINHADLNGRLYLSLESPPLLIDRRPDGRRFANPTSELDVFAPKSTRLLRSLSSGRDALWTQAGLTERSGLSRGLVSRLVRALVADGYLRPVTPATRQQAGTWRLAEFERLLDAWSERDDWPARGQLVQYSVLGDDAAQTARKLQGWLGASQPVFTQWFAANLRHPYTDTSIVSAYVPKTADLNRIPARPVPSGGNLWLIIPRDDGPLRETREIDGFRLACDVQIYLDLLGAGGRGPDHAQVLRQWSGFAR